jgi:hypothetical protein
MLALFWGVGGGRAHRAHRIATLAVGLVLLVCPGALAQWASVHATGFGARLEPAAWTGSASIAPVPAPAAAARSGSAESPVADPFRVPERRPITAAERRQWVLDAVFAPDSLASAMATSAWHSALDAPREWDGPAGFGQRVLAAQADTAISKSVEAGLGALWGEDPRRTSSGRRGTGARFAYALETVVLAPRRDGHLAPAWGRFAGIAVSSTVQNAWLPSRLTTPKETFGRMAGTLAARLAVNLLTEFGPDLRRLLPIPGAR